MNELQIFNNPKFGEIRTYIEPDGKVLFGSTDVARALGYSNPRAAISDNCKGVVKRDGVSRTVNQYGKETEQTVQMNFIPEGDIYRLAARSRLPGAEEFESWIFDEVLPSLRQTGTYTMQPMTAAEQLVAQAQLLVSMEQKLAAVTERVETAESLLLDVGEKAETAIRKAESAAKVYANPDKDHWVEDMASALRDLASADGWAEIRLRGKLYAELEKTHGHLNVDARLKRLKERKRQAGMTYREAATLTKLDAIAANKELRLIFEGIVKKHQAEVTVK